MMKKLGIVNPLAGKHYPYQEENTQVEDKAQINEAEEWLLAFEFKTAYSGEGRDTRRDLEKRFKKYWTGSGSTGKGWDVSFHGTKNELQKIKKYVEKTYGKDLDKRHTILSVFESAVDEYRGSIDSTRGGLRI